MVKRTATDASQDTAVVEEVINVQPSVEAYGDVTADVTANDNQVTDEVPAVVPAVVQRPTLRLGSRDAAVKDLQQKLNIRVTGVFDRITVRAVRMFQHMNNLKNNGIVDEKTWAALDEVLG